MQIQTSYNESEGKVFIIVREMGNIVYINSKKVREKTDHNSSVAWLLEAFAQALREGNVKLTI